MFLLCSLRQWSHTIFHSLTDPTLPEAQLNLTSQLILHPLSLSLSLLFPQSPPSLAMPLVLDFLTQIRNFIRTQNGDELRAWLQVEPNSPQQYHNLASELRSQFRQQGLDNIVERTLPQEDDVPEGQATVWPGFVAFMKDYMAFWRDVNYDDLLGAHQLLSGLVKYDTKHWMDNGHED